MINVVTFKGKYLIDSYFLNEVTNNPYDLNANYQVCGLRFGIALDKRNTEIVLFDINWYSSFGLKDTKHTSLILCSEVYDLMLKAEQDANGNTAWIDLTNPSLVAKLKKLQEVIE